MTGFAISLNCAKRSAGVTLRKASKKIEADGEIERVKLRSVMLLSRISEIAVISCEIILKSSRRYPKRHRTLLIIF